MAKLDILFKTAVNRYGARVRIFSDQSILLDNPTVLTQKVSPDRDYFCIGQTVQTHFSKPNISEIEFVKNAAKPPRKLLEWLRQTPIENMKLCYWRKEGKAIKITAKKVTYINQERPSQNQEFNNVEFILSIDEPEKMIEKLKELGFSVK